MILNNKKTIDALQLDVIRLTSLEDFDNALKCFLDTFRADNIFLSPAWQRSWLGSIDEFPQLVVFKRENHIVGYTLIGYRRPIKRLPVYVALLNRSGQSQQDQVWIEFNNIISSQADRSSCIHALLKHVFDTKMNCRLTVSMCDTSDEWLKAAQKHKIKTHLEVTPGYRLEMGNKHTASIINQFSSNTRSQIRRALKKATVRYGSVTVTEANSENNTVFLQALGEFHKKRWGQTTQGSGFDNNYFLTHHNTLITHYFTSTAILKIEAGNTILGYGYYLIVDNTVYFYCSGINYDVANNHLKPGYILHYMAAMHFAEKGFCTYDFMGGESQYKASLSNEEYAFHTITLFNNKRISKLSEWIMRLIRTFRLNS